MKSLLKNPFIVTSLGVVALALFLTTLFYLSLSGKRRHSSQNTSYSSDYSLYISEHTNGEISKISPIIFKFAEDCITTDKVNTKAGSVFDFSPNIKGEAIWTDERTIKFTPNNHLPSETTYEATIDLDDYINDIPDSLSSYTFSFITKKQDYNVKVSRLEASDPNSIKWYKTDGTIYLQDYENINDVKNILNANIDGKKLPVKWSYDSSNTYEYHFVIDSILRTEKLQKIKIDWTGSPINVDYKGEENLLLNALGDFILTDVSSVNSPEQVITFYFSDPLKAKQNLNGLISLNRGSFSYIINGSKLEIYPKNRISGSVTVKIRKGIKNIAGYSYNTNIHKEFSFSDLKPQLRLIDKKTIVPNQAKKIPFVFESVNLKAVDIRVIRIFEKNIAQFLQVNELNTNRELKRVGQAVYTGKIEFNKNDNLNTWGKRSIDLTKIIKPEPGAIYQIALGFRKSYALLTCEEDSKKANDRDPGENMLALNGWDTPSRYYDYYDDYYYYDDYSYEDRKDPCTPLYYTSNKSVSQNILASSIGLICKRSNNNEMLVIANDINTTQPLSGITIEVYDYQNKLMHTGKTNSKGMIRYTTEKAPFLVIAKKEKSRGYLKVNDGNALSLSNFETGGVSKYHGLNGFIYGERGVWRPGDTMYLSLIIEDRLNSLPVQHPVKFEFINPNGQKIIEKTVIKNTNGLYVFQPFTAPEDITGYYRVVAHVGGTTFRKTLPVETILPNRLRIKIGIKEGETIKQNQSIKLSSEWLHGAKANKLKADVMLSLTKSSTSFNKYKDYTFDNPSLYLNSEDQVVFDGNLDENGETSFNFNINKKRNLPGSMTAHIKTKVYEPSGNFSIDQFTAKYMHYDNYVGINIPKSNNYYSTLYVDTNNVIDFVSLTKDGKRSGSRNLKINVYKLGWKWWYSGRFNDVRYNATRHRTPVKMSTITTNENGKASYRLKIGKEKWGRYLIMATDEDGHSCGQVVYIDWPSWYNRAERDMPSGPNMLIFNTDKDTYTTGETVKVNFPSSKDGRALVTIETSEKIVLAEWVTTKDNNTSYSFKVNSSMTPNAYIHITYVQQHKQTSNDAPLRLYGISSINVINPATKLNPQIKMAKILRPNGIANISISEKDGKSMTYTIAVVGEGLLDITRFKTPNPWDHFYKKEALGVKTWDLFDQVIAYSNLKSKSLISIGGDGSLGGEKNNTKQNRFKPLVKFFGPFHIKPNQKRVHSFKIPNYIGSVRTMVVAEQKSAYGHAEKATPVREDLMVLGTLPRVLGIDENIDIPVTIFAMDEKVKDVTIEIISENPHIKITSDKKQMIHFNQTGEKTIKFSAHISQTIGTGTIKIIARSGNKRAVYHTDIEIRNPNLPINNAYDIIASANKTKSIKIEPIGITGTNNATIEISSVPPINLKKRLHYLIRYPYGCVEQTTSSVFPQLYLTKLVKLSNDKKRKIEQNIKDGIKRLSGFQQPNGGFSYWPHSYGVNDWGTNYAGHFLLEAKKAGYSLPSSMLENWKKYQKEVAISFQASSYHYKTSAQAYRLYLLAKAGSPQLGAMNRMRLTHDAPQLAKWYLSAAYVLAGQAQAGKRIIQGLSTNIKDYRELSGTYGSSTRDKAILLECLNHLGDKKQAYKMAVALSKELSSDKWMSTQTTAYSLVSIANYVGANDASKMNTFSIQINGKVVEKITTNKPIHQYSYDIAGTNPQEISIINKGGNNLFVKIITEGIPAHGTEQSSQSGLSLHINYKDLNGKSIDPTHIPQGTDFFAYISITNTGLYNYKEMALNQVFPSGWQIHNDRMDKRKNDGYDKPTYQDIRDDRVYTFFDINKGARKYFKIALNATYKGKYYLPTIQVEAMYDKSINARVKGQWIYVE